MGKSKIIKSLLGLLLLSQISFGQFINNGYRIVNAKLYTAPMDANFVYDAVANTSSATTVTSATANFKSSDVGKICELYGSATGGGSQVGTISGVTNSTTITVSFSVVTNVSSATFAYGTDCTAGIQRALTVADSLGIRDVYISGKGIIGGALVTSDNNGKNPNSQIYFPSQVKATHPHHNQIWLHGDGGNGQYFNYFGSNVDNMPADGTVLLSTLTSASGTNPGIFGTIGADGAFNVDYIIMSDFIVMAWCNNGKSSPVLTPFSFLNAATIQAYNVTARTDVDLTATSAPGEVAGWIASQLNNNGPNILSGCVSFGFKYGYFLSEHTQCISSWAYGSVYGWVIEPNNFTISGSIETAAVNWTIWYQDTTKMGITVPNSLVPHHTYPTDLTVTNEVDSGAVVTPPTFWYTTKGQVYDPSGFGGGVLRFQNIHGGTGATENQNIVTVGVNTGHLWIYPLNTGAPSGGSGTPVGGTNAIQYDSAGVFGGNNGAFGYNYSTGLIYSGGWLNTTDAFDIVKSQNSEMNIYFQNKFNSASNSASTFLGLVESAGSNQVGLFQLNSNKSSGSGLFTAGNGGVYALETHLVINNQTVSTGTIDMGNGTGTTPQLRIQNNGDITVGTGTDNSTAIFQILGTSDQLSLLYDATHHVEIFAGSGGGFNVVPSNGAGFITGHWEPNANVTYDLGASGGNAWRDIYFSHTVGQSTIGTSSSLGTNVSSLSLSGTDEDFKITLVTSGAVAGGLGNIAFGRNWGATPFCVISSADATTGSAVGSTSGGYIGINATSASSMTMVGAITASGTYHFNCHCGQ